MIEDQNQIVIHKMENFVITIEKSKKYLTALKNIKITFKLDFEKLYFIILLICQLKIKFIKKWSLI